VLALRLVLDTNVIISAALQEEGIPRTALMISLARPARLYVSQPVLDEYAEVLSRAELEIPRGARLRFLQLIKNRSFLVSPYRRLEVTSDPDDDIFIECADAARADYLITGNRKHFPRFWKGTKIIGPREFIQAAAPHLLGD
jgi:putative PIN family toxin of toxin-antitoxin system